jgi:hypothetical protein
MASYDVASNTCPALVSGNTVRNQRKHVKSAIHGSVVPRDIRIDPFAEKPVLTEADVFESGVYDLAGRQLRTSTRPTFSLLLLLLLRALVWAFPLKARHAGLSDIGRVLVLSDPQTW